MQTAGLTLAAAVAVAAAFQLQRLLHPELVNPHPATIYVEVFVRGLVLFAMGWAVAGVRLPSFRTPDNSEKDGLDRGGGQPRGCDSGPRGVNLHKFVLSITHK
jgi:hypothetical protein